MQDIHLNSYAYGFHKIFACWFDAHNKAVLSVHCCIPCTYTTVWLSTIPTSLLSLLMTQQWLASFLITMSSLTLNEVDRLALWCQDSNLHLNFGRTKEMLMDAISRGSTSPFLLMDPRWSGWRLLNILVSILMKTCKWTRHSNSPVRKAHRLLFHLTWLTVRSISASTEELLQSHN